MIRKVQWTRYVKKRPWGRWTITKCASRPPAFILNQYYQHDPTNPTETLGLCMRVYKDHYVSWVWPITFISY